MGQAGGDKGRWLALAALTFVYILNYLDRQLLGILAKPIQDSFHVTDGQLGLLGGLYFALFYCFIAIPVGWIADRTSRVAVLSVACGIWSAATAACGLAGSYSQLALGRLFVGFGEAGGVPPSYGIISATFPSEQRGLAFGVYHLGAPIGVALGIAFGAWIAVAFDWRYSFIAMGVVGIVTALVVRAIVREPARNPDLRGKADGLAVDKAPFWATVRLFFTHPTLLLMALGGGATQFVTYGSSNFTVLFLMREKGMIMQQIAVWYALALGLGMGGGMIASGRVIDRLARKGRRAYAIVPACALALALPLYLLFISVPDWRYALILLAIVNFFNFVYLAPTVALTQLEVQPNQRVLIGALLLLVMNFIGLGLGPTFVGAVSDVLAGHGVAHPLRGALYALAPFYGVAILLFAGASKAMRPGSTQHRELQASCA